MKRMRKKDRKTTEPIGKLTRCQTIFNTDEAAQQVTPAKLEVLGLLSRYGGGKESLNIRII